MHKSIHFHWYFNQHHQSVAIESNEVPPGVKDTFQPKVTLRDIFMRPKDCVLESDRTGVVHQIPCATALPPVSDRLADGL